MRDRAVRIGAAVVVAALLSTACAGGGDAGPTTTQFIPPTSEVIFSLTTTTTAPPGPLDPVFVSTLMITIDFPRDWEFRADDGLTFGRASALYRAENDAGGLIVVGAVEDLIAAAPPTVTPDDLAPQLATLLNVATPLPDDALRTTSGPVDGSADGAGYVLAGYGVIESGGAEAVMEIAVYRELDPAVFVAVLYQEGFPQGRIEQTRIFDSLTVGER